MIVWYPGHLVRAIAIGGLCIIVTGAFALSNRDASQRREIERLSSLSVTCPPIQAGERLVATVQKECGDGKEEMRCVYGSTSGYGRASRSRPAVPKEGA